MLRLVAVSLSLIHILVACPGGGYSHLAFEHEGCDWAPYFNKQGIASVSYTHLDVYKRQR